MDVSPFRGTTLIPLPVHAPHFRGWMCAPCGLLIVDYGSGILYANKETIARYDPDNSSSQ